MNNGTHPISADEPHGATEADLLAFVEGVLAPDREAVVLEALRQRKELGRVVAGMRRDCAALQTLDPVRAPADLVARALAASEPDSIDGLVEPEIAGPIPISTVRVRGVNPWRTLAESHWVRRVAVAACLCGALGAGAIALSKVQWSRPRTGQPIARQPAPRGPAIVDHTDIPAPIDIARDTTERGPAASPDSPNVEAPAVTIASNTSLEQGPITPERAAALARLGRLAVRVRTIDSDVTIARLDRLAERAPDRFAAWNDGLPALAAAVNHRVERAVPVRSIPNPIYVTGPRAIERSDPGIDSSPVPVIQAPVAEPVGAYMATLAPDDGTLRSLLTRIRGSTQTAEFVALPAPMPESGELPVPAWWLLPPQRWGAPVCVPVLVDRVAPGR